MRARRPPLTARMAALLDTLAFTCEVAVMLAPPKRKYGNALSGREALRPALERYAAEARALVAEYRGRNHRGSRA